MMRDGTRVRCESGARYSCKVVRRELKNDPFGRGECYDIEVRSEDGLTVLEDVSSSRRVAGRIARIFRRYRVSPVHALAVYEDLTADPDYID